MEVNHSCVWDVVSASGSRWGGVVIVNEPNELLSELFLTPVIKYPNKISLREKGLFYLIIPQAYGPSWQGRLGSSRQGRLGGRHRRLSAKVRL